MSEEFDAVVRESVAARRGGAAARLRARSSASGRVLTTAPADSNHTHKHNPAGL
jgi:hypothetical protein